MADTRSLPSMLLLLIAALLVVMLFKGNDSSSRRTRTAAVPTRRLELVTGRLAAAVEKLDLALARQPAREPDAGSENPSRVVLLPASAGGATPLPAPREIRPKQMERLEKLQPEDDDAKTILRRNVFRAYGEILDEFGYPDGIWLGADAIRFHYEWGGPYGNDHHVTFAFVDGMLMGVDR